MGSDAAMRLTPHWLEWPETQTLITAFRLHGDVLRFVGGSVRDAILGRDASDIDVATSLLPDDVMALLHRYYIQAIPTGIAHGTVTARIESRTFEITTLRKDTACDGRHAEVIYTDSWEEDAARRDFTMNALYLDPQGNVFDYCNGIADAQAGHVRFIGDAHQRVQEDYLRILRFYRFYAHYGTGDADGDARAACMAHAEHLPHISGERVQTELLKLLSADSAAYAISLMERDGVMAYVLGFKVVDSAIFSRLQDMEALDVVHLTPVEKLVGFALSAGGDAEQAVQQLAERLRLSRRARNGLLSWLPYVDTVTSRMAVSEQKHLLRLLGAQAFAAMVCMAWAASEDVIALKSPYGKMLTLAQEWEPPIFPITGADLIQAGFAPGRMMGDLMRTLQDAWEHSNYSMDKDALLAKANELQQ